jgi:hypothetical protein
MPRRSAPDVRFRPIPAFIAIAVIIAIAGMWVLFARTEAGRYDATRRVQQSRSEILMRLQITDLGGPLVQEIYELKDIDGVSSARYSATNFAGTTVHVAAPARRTKEYGSDVAYVFGQAVQDGIWELTDKPPRGNTAKQYTVYVSQLVTGQHGDRTITFTDPHYWATTGGHQYHIKLERNKPVPDLLQMKSTQIVDPRYQKVVDDITSFGSPGFRAAVATQRAKLIAAK